MLVTNADGISAAFVCLFFHTMSQKPMQLGSLNLTQKCSFMSPGNPFILGSKGQGHESQSIAGMGLCTLVSADYSDVQ